MAAVCCELWFFLTPGREEKDIKPYKDGRYKDSCPETGKCREFMDLISPDKLLEEFKEEFKDDIKKQEEAANKEKATINSDKTLKVYGCKIRII